MFLFINILVKTCSFEEIAQVHSLCMTDMETNLVLLDNWVNVWCPGECLMLWLRSVRLGGQTGLRLAAVVHHCARIVVQTLFYIVVQEVFYKHRCSALWKHCFTSLCIVLHCTLVVHDGTKTIEQASLYSHCFTWIVVHKLLQKQYFTFFCTHCSSQIVVQALLYIDVQ